MTKDRSTSALQAALDLWETLAAFAWQQHLNAGRGVVLADYNALTAAAEAGQRGETPELQLGYVGAATVPPGDDFRSVILEADPTRQVVLLIRWGDGENEEDEQLFVLEPAASAARPTPKECYAQSLRNAPSEGEQ